MKEAKALIEQIAEFLNRNDEQSRVVWLILTALRGPDSNNMAVKLKTTSIIRSLIGLRDDFKTAITSRAPLAKELFQPGYFREYISTLNSGESNHFSEHIYSAIFALQELGLVKPPTSSEITLDNIS